VNLAGQLRQHQYLIGPYMGTSPCAKTLGPLHAGHSLCWACSARLCRQQAVHRWKGHSSQPLHAPLRSCRRSRQSCGRHTGSRALPCTLTSAVTRWPARYPLARLSVTYSMQAIRTFTSGSRIRPDGSSNKRRQTYGGAACRRAGICNAVRGYPGGAAACGYCSARADCWRSCSCDASQ
jgi:hypothetical protein